MIEGALIAAEAVGASDVIIAMKRMHDTVRERTLGAIAELRAAGWLDRVDAQIFEGPNEYLYGEETAMLEAVEGRPPFPRIAPPYRRGVHEIVDRVVGTHTTTASAAHVELAGPGPDSVGSPTLVNIVETLANVPAIIAEGPDWFRSIGTPESPGSSVCTLTGASQRHGVGEVPMGTPLREVIDLIGGGTNAGRAIKAVIGGAATLLITAGQLDTPVSNEDMKAIGARLGCAGFIVFDDHRDMVAVAEGVARFLAIESCGLCIPCKDDGLALTELFGRIRRSQAGRGDRAAIDDHLRTVDNGRPSSSPRSSTSTAHTPPSTRPTRQTARLDVRTPMVRENARRTTPPGNVTQHARESPRPNPRASSPPGGDHRNGGLTAPLARHVDDSHHSEIFVVEDVAVVNGSADETSEWNKDPHRLACRNVHGVLPSRSCSLVGEKEGPDVEMQRVVHRRSVDDLPLFDGSRGRADVGAVGIEGLAVDRERHHLARPAAHHSSAHSHPELENPRRHRCEKCEVIGLEQ